MVKVRAEVLVSGKVQGVFFRSFIKRNALDLNISGWVRNNGDGDLQAVFEGEKNLIRELVLMIKQGPKMSRVEDMDVEYKDYTGDFSGFRIR